VASDDGHDTDSPLLRHSAEERVRRYASTFSDLMEMRAPAPVVATYLDRHEGWFRRCAAPMTVTPLGQRGYVLTLGRFGNFGFEVEPTIGLELLPQDEGVYRILTVPSSRIDPSLQGLYDVEFNAALRLDEVGSDAQGGGAEAERSHAELSHEEVDRLMAHTLVRWELDLSVWIRLPSMIALLPEGLVHSSGDRAPDLPASHLEGAGGFPRQPRHSLPAAAPRQFLKADLICEGRPDLSWPA